MVLAMIVYVFAHSPLVKASSAVTMIIFIIIVIREGWNVDGKSTKNKNKFRQPKVVPLNIFGNMMMTNWCVKALENTLASATLLGSHT